MPCYWLQPKINASFDCTKKSHQVIGLYKVDLSTPSDVYTMRESPDSAVKIPVVKRVNDYIV